METEQKTIKILIDEVTKKEVEVSLPYYSKTNCHNYKVVSETKCICVTRLFGDNSIAENSAHFGLDPKNKLSNEQEFEDAYADALVKLHETKITI